MEERLSPKQCQALAVEQLHPAVLETKTRRQLVRTLALAARGCRGGSPPRHFCERVRVLSKLCAELGGHSPKLLSVAFDLLRCPCGAHTEEVSALLHAVDVNCPDLERIIYARHATSGLRKARASREIKQFLELAPRTLVMRLLVPLIACYCSETCEYLR